MKKLIKINKLKVKVWKVFSEWVRRKNADHVGNVGCVTCGAVLFWKDGHAGHYYHGHSAKSFLAEENVHFQCRKCNHFLSGNLLNYHDYMEARYGKEKIEELKSLRYQIWKPTRQELNELLERYKTKLETLQKDQEKPAISP